MDSPEEESRIEALERELAGLKEDVRRLLRKVNAPSPFVKAIGRPFPKRGEPHIPIIYR